MFEKHTIGIVAMHDFGQGGVKIGAMNLMIIGTESFDIVVPARSNLDDIAGLKMAYQIRFGGTGLIRHPFPNAKKVERMHRVRCDGHTCADFSEFSTLLKNRNLVAEMLQCKCSGQPADTATHYGYPRGFHRPRLAPSRDPLRG